MSTRFRLAALVGTSVTALVLMGLQVAGERVQPINAVLVFLTLTLLISARYGVWASLVSALLSSLALAYFFIQPVFRLWADDPQYLAALAAVLMVSAIGASLLETARVLAEQARQGQAQAEALLRLNRAISGQPDPQASLNALCQEALRAFAATNAAVLVRDEADWRAIAAAGAGVPLRLSSADEAAVAERARAEGTSGHLTGEHDVVFVPLANAGRSLGVLRIERAAGPARLSDDADALMLAFAGEAALTITRQELTHAAGQASALKQADEMKTAIISSVSHELRMPIATLMAAATSLLDDAVDWSEADRRTFLASIQQEAIQLNKLVGSLLDLNRLQAGALRPILQAESLAQIVDEALELASGVLADREVTLDVCDVSLLTDRSLMAHAIANLLENAVVHSRQDGRIGVHTLVLPGAVELAVDDEGPGIERDQLAAIFTPFYRVANGRAAASGSGLGLAIVKGFVDLCGGQVEVESSAAMNRFVISLPLAPAAAGAR